MKSIVKSVISQKLRVSSKRIILIIIFIFCLGIAFSWWLPDDLFDSSDMSFLAPQLTPWQCVGGCGAGGSGGGSSGIKWVGEGVSGGMITVEVLPQLSFGRNFRTLTIPPRISFKPNWKTEVGLSIPISSKTAEVQYRSNQPARTFITGGLGDLSLDFSYTLGSEGQYSISTSLSLPNGQYDIRRGPEQFFLPNNLQMGTGIYNLSFGFNYTKDIENGLMLFSGSFSYPFNMKLFTKENAFLDEYYAAYKDQKDQDRFYYRFKPYGENDLGDYTPPSISLDYTYAYRGVSGYVHSFGFSFSAPLGVAWIHSENSSLYDPKPDPDHQAWSSVLSYGLEFSREKFPVFIGIGLPLHDKTASAAEIEIDEYNPDPMKKWNTPDFEDFFNQWIFGIGIKTTMF